ncbi:MAG: hypothetical protein IJZ80_00580 [Clostridia bacterium]|nr:hypothetical protein [Clostridia bacterium]
MKNIELRKEIKQAGLTHWEIANVLGISEFTFCRWLRKDFTEEQIKAVRTAIKQLNGVVKV